MWLTASDGHELGAYRADPLQAPRGSVVVLQEIFGVNRHIRSVCDRLAGEGYAALAPALFDRFARDFEIGYSDDEIAQARKLLDNLDWDGLMRDTRAAIDALGKDGPVPTMGFCLGGSVSFLAAVHIPGLSAAVCYYGGRIVGFADEAPRCPTQMHFGDKDQSIPLADVEAVRSKRPECEIHIYPAGHGFHCDERASYEPASARLAWSRSMEFLKRSFAGADSPG